MVRILAHRDQKLLWLVLGLLLIIIPSPVCGGFVGPIGLSGYFHQASAWGCVGMPVGGAPGIVTIVADQRTSGNLIVTANNFTANPDGTIWVIPLPYPLAESGSSHAVNFQYSGLQAVLLDDIIYVFTQNSATLLDLNSGTITGGVTSGTMNWATAKSVQYTSLGGGMSMFKALSSSDGVYLISQQKKAGASVLDISQISREQLEAPSGTIVPTRVCQIENTSGFLIPESQIYSAIITTYPGTNDTIIVGTSDSGGQVYSWYINPTNTSERGQTLLFSTSDLKTYFNSHLSTIALFQGSSAGDPAGINDLVVIAFKQDNTYYTPVTSGSTFCADLTKIGTPGYTWRNENIDYPDVLAQFYATPGLCTMYTTLPISNSNGNLRTNLFFYNMEQETDPFGSPFSSPAGGAQESNILVPDPVPSNAFDTTQSYDSFGNLYLPVGFIDGVPPIALNGHELDPGNVDSKVILIQTDTQETESSGSTESSVSAGFQGESEDGMSGVGVSYEQTIKQTTTASTEFSSSMIDTFPLDAEGGNDYAYMVSMAPQFVTQRFYVYDFNGNPPASGVAKTVYITYPAAGTPYKNYIQGYDITNPPKTGWLAGALQSPLYNNFNYWNWATMTGGWHNRDWSQSPQVGKLFTVYKFNENLEFNNGASQTTTYTMTDSLSHTYDVEHKISTDARILGFGGSNDMTYDQESGITNSIQKGLEFYWSMAMPDNGGSGYQTVVIEPQIITPIEGAGAVPWAPGTYAPYQPWLITYNLLSADMTSGTPPSERNQRLATEVDPRLSGTITMTPVSPKKGEMVEFKADPAPGYVFSHWKAWGVGLDDLSSSTTSGRITNDISTIRAYFEQSGSDQITTADFRIPPEPAGGTMTIKGKIPDGLTWAVAMGVKYPLDVTAGSVDFLFGPTVGERTVLSPQEILFTTKNKKNETSQLILNFNTKTWTFSSPQTQNLGGSVLGTHTVRLGISGKDFTGVEDLPLAGTEVLSWTGGNPVITNDVFSFDKNTIISGNFTYEGVDQGKSTFQIRRARLTNGTVDPTVPVTLTVNQVKVQFDNATKSDNSMYTYTKSQGDLFTSLLLDSKSKTWQVDMSGKRLTHITWPEDVPIGLQIGPGAARATINPEITANLHLQRKEPIQVDFTAIPKTGTPPLTVQFSDLSSGHPTTWNWSFGDGSSVNATRQNPVHTYTGAGTYTVSLTATNSGGSNLFTRTNYITATSPTTSPTVGVFRNGTVFIAGSNTNGGLPVNAFNFGQAGDIPTAGDWNTDGKAEVGIFRTGNFFLASSNTPGGGTVNAFNFGQAGDIPVAGKWSGSGAATVGIFRSGKFYLASSNTPGGGTVNAFNFGQAGDIPIAGDWNGDGTTTVGIFRNGMYALASHNFIGGGLPTYFTFGQAGDIPVTGDWNTDGKTEVGVFRNGAVYLASSNTPGGGTVTAFTYGMAGDVPIAGKWI